MLTRDNLNVSVKSYIPQSKEKLPVIFLVHMLGKDKTSWNKFIPKLLENNYAIFNIDMRGHGRSTKIKNGQEILYTSMNETDWKKLPGDINDVISFISNEKFIDSNRIAIIGASIGANSAIVDAANHPGTVKAVVALSPGLDYHGILTLESAKKLEAPILLVASEGDKYAFDSINQLNKVVKTKHDLLIYKGTEHGTNLLNKYDSLESKVISWLNENFLDKK
jgi:dienelactone hydrolase